eukprot:4650193-Amphidinium_carterae.3
MHVKFADRGELELVDVHHVSVTIIIRTTPVPSSFHVHIILYRMNDVSARALATECSIWTLHGSRSKRFMRSKAFKTALMDSGSVAPAPH